MANRRSKKLEYPSGLTSMLSTIKDKMIVGRVTDIILNDQHPEFLNKGGWSSIGTIFFEENDLQGSNNPTTARPFFPQTSAYPLVNELVLLFSLPNQNIGSNTSSESYYYINIVSVWNSPHHNAYPNPITSETPPSEAKDYFQTEAGSFVRKTDSGSLSPDGNSIKLNSPINPSQQTFIERNNIHPLLPFAGDIIYEGRWGNSIRFGSTSNPNPKPKPTPDKSTQTTPQPSSPSSLLSDSASQTFTSGNSNLSSNFKNSLLKLNNFVFSKTTSDSNFTLKSVSVIGSESQVTNPSGIPKGGLARSRADKALNLIKSEFNFLKNNLTSRTVIGSTPYVRGQDDPNDAKYTKEQFVRVKILFTLNKDSKNEPIKTPTPPLTPPASTPVLNNWSNVGKNGDPIIILRNGQDPNSSNEGWTSITENLNKDLSSIYLTSTQKIPIKVASQRYFSYTPRFGEIPISPESYTENQIILNSGRLLFNSKTDHILLSSQRTISFEAVKGFNFDTPANFVIDAGTDIKLGSKDATEPLVKGETLRQELDFLLKSLIQMVEVLKYTQSWPGGGAVVDAPTSTTADGVEKALTDIRNNLDNILSTKTKTI